MIFNSIDELEQTRSVLEIAFGINLVGDTFPKNTSDSAILHYENDEYPLNEGRLLMRNVLNRCYLYYPKENIFSELYDMNFIITWNLLKKEDFEVQLYYFCVIEALLTVQKLTENEKKVDAADILRAFPNNMGYYEAQSLELFKPSQKNKPLLSVASNDKSAVYTPVERRKALQPLNTFFKNENEKRYLAHVLNLIDRKDKPIISAHNKYSQYIIPAYNSDLFLKIFREHRSLQKIWKYEINHSISMRSLKSLIDEIFSLEKSIDAGKKTDMALLDTILLTYNVEKYFYPSFLRKAYMLPTDNGGAYDTSYQSKLETLYNCTLLPLPYFRQYLFDRLDVSGKRIMSQKKFASPAKSAQINDSEWITNSIHFIKELAYVFLPLVYKVFFIKLYDCLGKDLNKIENWCIHHILEESDFFLNNPFPKQKDSLPDGYLNPHLKNFLLNWHKLAFYSYDAIFSINIVNNYAHHSDYALETTARSMSEMDQKFLTNSQTVQQRTDSLLAQLIRYRITEQY